MKIVADLHLHSKYSRAVSQQMNIPIMALWAKKKGIDLVGTSDWTHPMWFRELKTHLVEKNEGLYQIKEGNGGPFFILSTELSCIYTQGDESRRIHLVVLAPSLEVVERINKKLTERNFNLFSDGRPILGISAKNLTEIILTVDEYCLIIPAHIWTPWFSLYGSKSGFDSINECFGEFSKHIYGVETGLSSDPAMNWRIEELGNRSIISFSDAHSPQKLGREVTVFELPEMNYKNLREAIVGKTGDRGQRTEKINQSSVFGFQNLSSIIGPRISHTIEFYPEEGKYHYTGHRKCKVVYSPNEARKKGITCPVCGKPLTVGVMSRVEALATSDVETESETDKFGVRWIKDKKRKNPPYVMLVPLMEIISESMQVGVNTKTTQEVYERLVSEFGDEFSVLLKGELADLEKVVSAKIVEGIKKVRSGDIVIKPGFDGIFGDVRIWKSEESFADEAMVDQKMLF